MESPAEKWAHTTIRKRAAVQMIDPESGEVLAEQGQIISPELYQRITATLASSYYISCMYDVVVERPTTSL